MISLGLCARTKRVIGEVKQYSPLDMALDGNHDTSIRLLKMCVELGLWWTLACLRQSRLCGSGSCIVDHDDSAEVEFGDWGRIDTHVFLLCPCPSYVSIYGLLGLPRPAPEGSQTLLRPLQCSFFSAKNKHLSTLLPPLHIFANSDVANLGM
ncbi:hypothetical protein JB92DRAFT_3099290 [Gautieria morchelliformis]|nr:hypothetical protein JB92DRAFT_3099290 [Gautieria morchelliformis]